MKVVTEFTRELQSYEEYSFSTEELYQKTLAPQSSIKKELACLVADSRLINPRKGFYLILSPNHQHYKRLPIELYIDKLFKTLNKLYYMGYHSAAALHGASHQKVQQAYVITELPVPGDITKGNLKIRFFTYVNWPAFNILQRKSDTGFFNLSSPALTFANLLDNLDVGGNKSLWI